MNRRTFTTTALLGLAVATALPHAGLAQSNPWLGMWKLNLAKSTYPPGQAPRSSTYNFQVAGANLTNTVETVDAAGSSTTTVNPHIYDGQTHPLTGNPNADARNYTRVDANTVISASMKEANCFRSLLLCSPRMAGRSPPPDEGSTRRDNR